MSGKLNTFQIYRSDLKPAVVNWSLARRGINPFGQILPLSEAAEGKYTRKFARHLGQGGEDVGTLGPSSYLLLVCWTLIAAVLFPPS